MSRVFRFDVPAVLHLGRWSRDAMFGLGMALTAAIAPAQAAATPTSSPLVQIAPQQTLEEIVAQIKTELEQARLDAMQEHDARLGLTAEAYAQRQAREQVEIDRLNRERESFQAGAEALARDRGIGTCFGGFLNGHAHQADLERSTLLLAAKRADGKTMYIGTGFVVRDSADVTGHNRIVTARHVVTPADADEEILPGAIRMLMELGASEHPEATTSEALHKALFEKLLSGWKNQVDEIFDDVIKPYAELSGEQKQRIKAALGLPSIDHVDAYASDGSFVGRVEVVTKGQPNDQPTPMNDPSTPRGLAKSPDDWAVVRVDITRTPNTAIGRFDVIPGLALAPIQAPEKTIGVSGDGIHPAATPGYSGGPVVDADGLVHGVVAGIQMYSDVNRGTVKGMVSLVDLKSGQGFESGRGEADMPVRQPLFVNPLGAPRLLAALGHAGQAVITRADAPLYTASVKMTLVGMPGGYCAAAPTVQARMGGVMPDLAPPPLGASPWQISVSPDGTKRQYDSLGRLAAIDRPDGVTLNYEAGALVSILRPDGSTTFFEGGKRVMELHADGSSTAYKDGKPMLNLSATGVETAPHQDVTGHRHPGAQHDHAAHHPQGFR